MIKAPLFMPGIERIRNLHIIGLCDLSTGWALKGTRLNLLSHFLPEKQSSSTLMPVRQLLKKWFKLPLNKKILSCQGVSNKIFFVDQIFLKGSRRFSR